MTKAAMNLIRGNEEKAAAAVYKSISNARLISSERNYTPSLVSYNLAYRCTNDTWICVAPSKNGYRL
jgi:hypothetical protein